MLLLLQEVNVQILVLCNFVDKSAQHLWPLSGVWKSSIVNQRNVATEQPAQASYQSEESFKNVFKSAAGFFFSESKVETLVRSTARVFNGAGRAS